MAQKSNLVIDQGATFTKEFEVVHSANSDPASLTGYTAAGSIRKSYSANTVAAVDQHTTHA